MKAAHVASHPLKLGCHSGRPKSDRSGEIFLQRGSGSYCSGDKDYPFAFIGIVKSRITVASFATRSKCYQNLSLCHTAISNAGSVSVQVGQIRT